MSEKIAQDASARAPKRERRRALLLILLGVLIGALAVAIAGFMMVGSCGMVGAGTATGTVGKGTETFTIHGDATQPLVPGRSVPIDLSVSNDHDRALTVTAVRIVVTSVTAPRATAALPCTVGDFTVGRARGLSFTVGANGTRTLSELGIGPASWPQVTMRDTSKNQNGCMGASVTLAYSATGRLATR